MHEISPKRTWPPLIDLVLNSSQTTENMANLFPSVNIYNPNSFQVQGPAPDRLSRSSVPEPRCGVAPRLDPRYINEWMKNYKARLTAYKCMLNLPRLVKN